MCLLGFAWLFSGHRNEKSLKTRYWSQRSLAWDQTQNSLAMLSQFPTHSVKESEAPQEGGPQSSSPVVGWSDSSLQVPMFLHFHGETSPLVPNSSHYRYECGSCPRNRVQTQAPTVARAVGGCLRFAIPLSHWWLG